MGFEEESIELVEFTWLPGGDKALVKTLGREKLGFGASGGDRQRSHSQFVLRQKGTEWMVVDLTINGVNLAKNFHSQIESLLQRGKSFDQVLDRMQGLAGVK